MKRFLTICFLAPFIAMNVSAAGQAAIEWTQVSALPDAIGFAGSFAGVSGGTLLVAGGANFPERPPWQGGTKVWHDRVFAFDTDNDRWSDAGRLPQPNGYGVSVTVPSGLVLIGGGDATRNFADVWLARYDAETRQTSFTRWPNLPVPLAMAAGALVEQTIYVAGGIDRPDATSTQRAVYALDLQRIETGWREVEASPAPGRILASASAHGDTFFLFAGSDLTADANGKPERIRLRDAWAFSPRQGWRRLANLPRIAVAAPSPAPLVGGSLLVLGGDDGVHVATPPEKHPGFPRDVLAYGIETDSWSNGGALPFSLVTTSTAFWRGRIVVPGGEARPGVRSTDVWFGEPR